MSKRRKREKSAEINKKCQSYWNPQQAVGDPPHYKFFTSVDPLRDKYASWGPYVYTLSNPVKYFDPDGRDAIPITFNEYLINDEKGGLGHAGILLIDNETGDTKYWDYGRFGDPNGVVRTERISNVEIDEESGLPTEKSLTRVLHEIADNFGKDGDIQAAYIINDYFKEMNAYARERYNQNENEDREQYNTVFCNCSHFIKDVLKSGNMNIHPMTFFPIPNVFLKELRKIYPQLDYDYDNIQLEGYNDIEPKEDKEEE